MSTFGQRLAARIEATGISQSELGRRTGIHRNQVAKWIREENEPTIGNAVAAARALGCNPAWLIAGEGLPEVTETQSALSLLGQLPQRARLGLLSVLRDLASEGRDIPLTEAIGQELRAAVAGGGAGGAANGSVASVSGGELRAAGALSVVEGGGVSGLRGAAASPAPVVATSPISLDLRRRVGRVDVGQTIFVDVIPTHTFLGLSRSLHGSTGLAPTGELRRLPDGEEILLVRNRGVSLPRTLQRGDLLALRRRSFELPAVSPGQMKIPLSRAMAELNPGGVYVAALNEAIASERPTLRRVEIFALAEHTWRLALSGDAMADGSAEPGRVMVDSASRVRFLAELAGIAVDAAEPGRAKASWLALAPAELDLRSYLSGRELFGWCSDPDPGALVPQAGDCVYACLPVPTEVGYRLSPVCQTVVHQRLSDPASLSLLPGVQALFERGPRYSTRTWLLLNVHEHSRTFSDRADPDVQAVIYEASSGRAAGRLLVPLGQLLGRRLEELWHRRAR
mgnify:CR=1 FL=1